MNACMMCLRTESVYESGGAQTFRCCTVVHADGVPGGTGKSYGH